MINLKESFAYQSWIKEIQKSKRINVENHKSLISDIETYFNKYTTDPMFVIIPRFNKTYLSLRFCGLEVLQITKMCKVKLPLYYENGTVLRRSKNPPVINDLSDISLMMSDIIKFLSFKAESKVYVSSNKRKDLIPGFSFEHWLESLFLSHSNCGIETRKHIDMDYALNRIVTQVPIIKKPQKGCRKRRVDHIDIIGVSDDHVDIVELKKDRSLNIAKEEIDRYESWLLSKLDEVDPDRGNYKSMIEEGYMPEISFDISAKRINRKIIIVDQNRQNYNDRYEIYYLPDNWLDNAKSGRNLFTR